MCYKIAVLLECPFTHIASIQALSTMYGSMFYKSDLMTESLITHITSIRVLITKYITGIPAFSTVCMKLFIHSAMLKTRRLNTRIYSDRKTIIFIAMYTLNKNPLHWRNCYLQECIQWLTIVCIVSSFNKTPAITLCHTSFRVLHEMLSGTLL
jgi:hypothetical protein